MRRQPLPILMLLAFALVVDCGSAKAAYDPIGRGVVRLSLHPGFKRFLGREGIELKARDGGTVSSGGSAIALPAVGGRIDPTMLKGTIETSGEVVLIRGRKKLAIRDLTLKSKRTPLFARVGGGQQKVVSAGRVFIRREGFGALFVAHPLRLTFKTATRLDKRLDVASFSPGQLIGSLRASVSPSTICLLPTGDAVITLDPSFQAKLKSLFVAVTPIFPAEANAGSFQLPVEGRSAISQTATEGILRTGGSLEFLQLGGGPLFWHEAWLDLGAGAGTSEADVEPSPPYAGRVGRTATLDFDLTAAARSADPSAHTISESGAPIRLDAGMAADFDQAFAEGRHLFDPGEAIGALSFGVTTQ